MRLSSSRIESIHAYGVASWLRMKKPGPFVAICFTAFQVFMSITLTTPSLRFGVAITGLPSWTKVMPEPRCGMPGRSRSAILRRTSRCTTCPLPASRDAPITSL